MPYAEIPGANLWYLDTGGDGVPVVFLHARSGTSESWVHQVPAFHDAGFRCITYDRRDSGRSKPMADAEQPGFGSEDLDQLADYLGLGALHLVATAAGGAVAFDYAISYQDRLRSLVVADAVGRVVDDDYRALQKLIRPPEIESLPIELRELSPGYRGLNPEGTKRWLKIAKESHWEGLHQIGQPTRNEVTFDLLATIRVPTLLLVGDAELMVPPALMRVLARSIHGCEFVTIPEAGHSAFWEQPDAWNKIVLTFISQH